MSFDRTVDRTDTPETADPTDVRGLTRRRVLQGAAGVGVIGVAGTVLAACGGEDEPSSTTSESSGSDPGTTSEPDPETSGEEGAAAGIATTADVPVSGGLVLESEKVVITQPADGDFKAFTAICTHQGCTVGEVTDNVIMCPCHGSTYDASTGEVTGGPATAALAAVEIVVDGDQITLA